MENTRMRYFLAGAFAGTPTFAATTGAFAENLNAYWQDRDRERLPPDFERLK